MIERTEIRLGGFGGQGIVTAGYLLGKAAILERKQAVLTKAFGPEIRGARVRADVVISTEAIDYPQAERPDLLVCFAQDAFDRLSPGLRPETRIFIDEDLVRPADRPNVFAISAFRMAKELGNRVVANNIMLGFVVAVTEVVSCATLQRAVLDAVPHKAKVLNQRALEAGFEHHATLLAK